MSRKPKLLVASILLALSPLATAQVTPPPPTTPPPTTTPAPTTTSVPANRLAGLFAGFLGSRDNALALVNALRNGTSATLVSTPTCAAPCTTPPTGTSTSIEVGTKPMGWGNVRHALALAQFSLAQAGISHPTPDQVAAALNGGTVTTGAGTPVDLRGVLTMRASGMGWGQIAHAEGTTMGNVNHSIKPFNAVTTPVTTAAAAPAAPKGLGITSAAGASAGVVSAGGGAASSSPAGRGIVTAGGGTVGIAHGNGGGNGNGIANGHASGAAAGVGMTTAANTAASTTVVTAQGSNGAGRGVGNGNGHGNGNGNGKGG